MKKVTNLFALPLLILGVISMQLQAKTLTRDEAQIRSNINSYAALADQNAFEYLGRLFAQELTLDYTALFGGEIQTVKREDLMKQWAGFLPGFDTTYHELNDLTVHVKDSQAVAHVNFSASHYLDEGFWQVSGQYSFNLVKNNESWQITSVTLLKPKEQGSREVLGLAPTLAEQNLKSRNALKVLF